MKRIDWDYGLWDTVHEPRVHHQLLPNIISAESTLHKDVIRGLQDRGHEVVKYPSTEPRSEIQVVERLDGMVYAVSDYRKRGVAAGY